MKKNNWDHFKNDDEILKYLMDLPRYKNTATKSILRRALFFLNIVFCRIFKVDKPIFIILVTNNNCNLKCTYCYGNYGYKDARESYSTRELLKIIDKLKDLGTRLLTIHGGESLLRKDIGEIINYAKYRGFYISLNTNGYFVPYKMEAIKKLDAVCLSLDGAKESNDKNRGGGCYDKVMKAIDVLHENSIPVVISATLTKDNIHDMEFLAKLAVEKKFRIQYSILYNSSELKDTHLDIVLNDSEIRRIVKEILFLKKKGYPVYYSKNVLEMTINWPFSHEEKPFVTKYDFLKNQKLIPCYHGKLKYYIDADGRVVTCWAHNYHNAPNLKTLGVAKAIKECQKGNTCRYCSFLANNEQNALMHLYLGNILNILFIQVADALKIKES